MVVLTITRQQEIVRGNVFPYTCKVNKQWLTKMTNQKTIVSKDILKVHLLEALN